MPRRLGTGPESRGYPHTAAAESSSFDTEPSSFDTESSSFDTESSSFDAESSSFDTELPFLNAKYIIFTHVVDEAGRAAVASVIHQFQCNVYQFQCKIHHFQCTIREN